MVEFHLEAAAKRLQRERDAQMSMAWHQAAFGRAKRLPNLRDVLSSKKAPGRQTWQEQKAAVKEIFARKKRSQ